jgi:hypothetical protein
MDKTKTAQITFLKTRDKIGVTEMGRKSSKERGISVTILCFHEEGIVEEDKD